MARWLLKSEAEKYGWDDLMRDGATHWDGVRNNAARLHLRAMSPGDEAFLYHSVAEKAIVGIVRITGKGEPDGEDGHWVKVPVAPVRPLMRPVSLAEIKAEPALARMELLRQSRLSVVPIRDDEWECILTIANA